MRVMVWKCAKTGDLFEKAIDYKRHLCRRRAMLRFAQNKADRLAKIDREFVTLHNLSSFEEIEEWFNSHGHLLAERQRVINPHHYRPRRKGAKPKPVIFKDFTLSHMRWQDSCRNTHCSPKGKPQNFMGKPDLPTGYPGWRGRVEFTLLNFDDFSSRIMDETGIHTGTGGGGNTLSYDVTLFAEEWPMLAIRNGFVAKSNEYSRSRELRFIEGDVLVGDDGRTILRAASQTEILV